MADKYVIVRREPSGEMMTNATILVAGIVPKAFQYIEPSDARKVIHTVHRAMISASSPPVSLEEIVGVLKTLGSDYMTSATHHPCHVLVPTANFERARSLLSRLKEMEGDAK